MSDAAELVQAVLCEHRPTHEQAMNLIDAALEMDVDPLAYCSRRFGLGDALVFERAANWAGMAFYGKVPRRLVKIEHFARLEGLGEIRGLRAKLFDREILFSAPLFFQFLKLKRQFEANQDGRRWICVVPPGAIIAALADASSELLLNESRQRLARRWPFATAHLDLSWPRRLLFVIVVVAIAFTALTPVDFSLLFLPASIVFLLGPAVLRLLAVGAKSTPDRHGRIPLPDQDLPVYTVLIPLRDEARMVPLLARSMLALDYPPEKLDIKFIVETRSPATIAAVEKILNHGPFELIAVPDQTPRTKPKALNYALPFIRGEHVVVYDAEDIPDPNQLRLAAEHFAAELSVSCLQATLVIDNAAENPLTALYAGEYAGLFRVMLPALARWGLPMPLGGTSNHFRVTDLKAVGGWDAFNVTEDADLGIRLSRLHYKSAILASETREEAPIRLGGWMAQRTRWMKGWMQTFIVHNRNPRQFLRDTGWRSFLAFEIYMGGIILAPLLHTIFLVLAPLRLLVPGFGTTGGGYWGIFNLTILAIGYLGAVALVIKGLWQQRLERLLAYQLLLPFYWALHSIATARALIELLQRPYFWAKTDHGRTRIARNPTRGKARQAVQHKVHSKFTREPLPAKPNND
jgi:cellulose synthase/poly-beta-1,6-N-acetylglucosamine synthase-like glycosyltransferase